MLAVYKKELRSYFTSMIGGFLLQYSLFWQVFILWYPTC